MVPNYVAKKNVLFALNFWLILFSFLIIPLIIQIWKIIVLKSITYEFYDYRIIRKSGVFNKKEERFVFAGVYSVSMYQSFWGRVFNYGDVMVDAPGEWDINTCGIKNPKRLAGYLEKRITARGMTNIIYN